ncbi:hypothetical protein ACFRAR_22530 [Kitasatospora sp. NPDC056651]|uniref:hypothetical protein n=1 Tax=Kitasatospora sp. NPDC056651 TaxID=3345892 RepID=UPI0036914054
MEQPNSRTGRLIRAGCALAAALLAGTAAAPAQAAPGRGDTELVSVGPDGAKSDGWSKTLGLSGDGRYALFMSEADNLVPGDTNGRRDLFVRDLWTRHTERVNLADDGTQPAESTSGGAISGDGRYVAFSTEASGVAPGEHPGRIANVYVRDLRTGRTELVTTGDPASDQSGRNSFDPVLSWDGRYVAFSSTRTDLVPGAAYRPWAWNDFVTDRRTGTTTLITVGADGSPANAGSGSVTISADGATIGFSSAATNLLAPDGPAAPPPSPAGTPPGLTAPRYDPYYVYDARAGRIRGASIDADGALRRLGDFGGTLSADGRYAVFTLNEPGGPPDGPGSHLELYVRDLRQGTVTKVSTPLPGTTTTRSSRNGVMGLDGRWVVFASDAENLVPGDTNGVADVFRHDLWTGRTERVSVAPDGSQTPGASSAPVVDATGSTVLFVSQDGTLTPGDTNGVQDVFVRRLPPL